MRVYANISKHGDCTLSVERTRLQRLRVQHTKNALAYRRLWMKTRDNFNKAQQLQNMKKIREITESLIELRFVERMDSTRRTRNARNRAIETIRSEQAYPQKGEHNILGMTRT